MGPGGSWISFPPLPHTETQQLCACSHHDYHHLHAAAGPNYYFFPQPPKLEDLLRDHPLHNDDDDAQDSSSVNDARHPPPPLPPPPTQRRQKHRKAHDDVKLDPCLSMSSSSVSHPARSSAAAAQRTSVYRGVTRHRWTGRYEAHLWDNTCQREGNRRKGRQVYLGGYDKEDNAARAYDLAALKYWGLSATTNFPLDSYSKEIEEMKEIGKQEFIASIRRGSSGFSRGASIYRGVTRHHQHGRWQARIGRVAGNKDLYLGTFATEEEAAEAYDVAAIKFRGANAVTNFELSRYDVETIDKHDLPIGGSSKRLKHSLCASSSSRQAIPDTSYVPLEPPECADSTVLHNGLQLPSTTDSSSPLTYYNFGEIAPDPYPHSFYWIADNQQQHSIQFHVEQPMLGSSLQSMKGAPSMYS